jgi:flagellar hook-basal body complex protein FliE
VTLPPIGAIGGVLPQSATAPLSPGETSGIGAGSNTGVGGLGGASEVGGSPAPSGVEGTGGVESGGFGEALTQAISSLDKSQQSADGAAQALATGTASNPESAVVTVEDAQLAMQLASQIRTKAVEATQQIFQTQV